MTEQVVVEKYDVKTAKSKMGKMDVKSFDDLDAAKAHLEKMKQKGHKGIISKNGKPVNEGSKEEYKKVFDAAMKKFKISSLADLKSDELKKKFFNYVDANYKAKDESVSSHNLDEAKYDIYHKTYSSAVQHAVKQAEKQGYEVDENDYDNKVALGPKKPSVGKTNKLTVKLTKNGKPSKKFLQMQVYGMDSGKYELNMYVEGAGEDEDEGEKTMTGKKRTPIKIENKKT